MGLLLTGGFVFRNGRFENLDVAIDQGRIVSISPSLPREGFSVIELQDRFIVPGFVDVHVHLREPGFSYKETIASGTAAAAAGGYTAVCAMPNLKPVPESRETLQAELSTIARSARVHVYPYGAITCGEQGTALADLAAMAPDVAGFSDDGRGVQSREMMREAMLLAKKLDKPIVAHCEDESLLTRGWCVHDGAYAAAHGHKGISSESEWRMVERAVALAEETGAAYHVCHVSTKESVDIIRRAKARVVDVTCETAPHYLVLTEEDIREEGRFKMNPPLRTEEDRAALREGLADGTVDMVATDHAPHSDEEKSRGLKDSPMGVIGLEFAFPVLYTELVKKGVVTLHRLVQAMSSAPAKRFGLPGGDICDGCRAELAVFDLCREWTVRGKDSASKGSSTPFEGRIVKGKNLMTIHNGEIIWKE